jgi:protease YdgD
LAAAIVLSVLTVPIGWALAGEKTGGSAGAATALQPGIGAPDRRIRVDPDVVPWRAVGKLQAVTMSLRESCTATLVGPSTVVTAAHCVLNRLTQRNFPPGSLHFLVGYNSGRYAGHAIGVKVKIADGYNSNRPNETIGSDWALVTLDNSLGSADRILPMLGDMPENGAKVMLGGYQKDYPLVLMADTQCRIVARFVDPSGRLLLRHNCAGTNGVSGAPLLIHRDNQWQVAAIAVAEATDTVDGAAVVLDHALKTFSEEGEPPAGD